jgi:hypothetical protein
MFNDDLAAGSSWWATLDDVERRRWRVSVDIRVVADVCAPRLAKRWTGRHEEGEVTKLLTLCCQRQKREERRGNGWLLLFCFLDLLTGEE